MAIEQKKWKEHKIGVSSEATAPSKVLLKLYVDGNCVDHSIITQFPGEWTTVAMTNVGGETLEVRIRRTWWNWIQQRYTYEVYTEDGEPLGFSA